MVLKRPIVIIIIITVFVFFLSNNFDFAEKIKLIRYGALEKMDESVRKVSVQTLCRSQRENPIDVTAEVCVL